MWGDPPLGHFGVLLAQFDADEVAAEAAVDGARGAAADEEVGDDAGDDAGVAGAGGLPSEGALSHHRDL